MNANEKRTKISEALKKYHVHYLHMKTDITHKPCRDSNGIHCTGDKFQYIVDWQIANRKKVDAWETEVS
ncbi:hypothetical protein [Mangrovibacterium sp.]|uniref:hypothetical protein n=1 Tax=Mangrovibacterium sp. TaxID=1961364 RepID=UPI00356ADD17